MNDPNTPHSERRASNRIDTEGQLPGQLALDMETDVLQMSVGGMLVETPMPLALGSRHQFTVGIGDDEIELSGTVRNCQPHPPSGQPKKYRVGVEFCDLSSDQQKALESFVNTRLRGG
jgi:hypothetical protein